MTTIKPGARYYKAFFRSGSMVFQPNNKVVATSTTIIPGLMEGGYQCFVLI
jgi:hypothetical protein